MRAMRGVLLVVLGVGVLLSFGCQEGQLKEDVAALKKHNDRLMQQNAQRQREIDDLKRQQAVAPSPSSPDPVEVEPRRTETTVEKIRRGLPPGTKVSMRGDKPVILLEEGMINYGSGKAGVTAKGKRTLDQVARLLNTSLADSMVEVEGHTDTDPIRKTAHLYRNNWELGMKRATGVVDYLISKGVDPKRLKSTSYGEKRPISTTQKSKNRRVEIVVLTSASGYEMGGPAATYSGR